MSSAPVSVRLGSRLLDAHRFAHGFSLRTGGVSLPPFDSLNLARSNGDAPAHVDENHRRFALAAGYDPLRLYQVSQVHGATVRVVVPPETPRDVAPFEADALVAREPGAAVGVRVADCIPLLLADPEAGAVAAVHAGWRGVVAGVAPAALEALEAPAHRLLAAIGPHIRACCFEVGEDVAAEIAAVARPGVPVIVRDASRAKPHVDLTAVLVDQLRAHGVQTENIDDVGGCTRCEPSRFFSFRRDGKRSGRHLGAIAAR